MEDYGSPGLKGIKAAKSYIRKIVGTHSMTVEESISVLNEFEAVLNSRPLCTLNVSPKDGIEVLTPTQFWLDVPSGNLPVKNW